MKKALVILTVFAIAFAYSTLAMAAGTPDVHMNVRFIHSDQTLAQGGGTTNRMQLHVVELKASQEVENVGGSLIYRFNSAADYPVNANVYIKSGAHKLTGGLQFVPFGIYNWNNLYNPLLDIPGQMGQIWDFDWGLVYSYDAKPVLLKAGWFDNGASDGFTIGEQAESDTLVLRLGYDIVSSWNVGVSFLNGESNSVKTTKYGVDTTWGITPALSMNGQVISYQDGYSIAQAALGDGYYGHMQLKYDITNVPAPLNGVSLVTQFSFDKAIHTLAGAEATELHKNFQQQISIKVAENLTIFWQFIQDIGDVANTSDKDHLLAVKYDLF